MPTCMALFFQEKFKKSWENPITVLKNAIQKLHGEKPNIIRKIWKTVDWNQRTTHACNWNIWNSQQFKSWIYEKLFYSVSPHKKHNLLVPYRNTCNYGDGSIKALRARIWNSQPDKAKLATLLKIFKNFMKNWLWS